MAGGRTPGSKNKRTVDGGILAATLLDQTKGDEESRDPNPVVEALKRQFRAGVGNGSMTVQTHEGPVEVEQIPATFFVHTLDRRYGKVVDRIKMNVGGKAYDGESTEDLAKRAELLLAALKGNK